MSEIMPYCQNCNHRRIPTSVKTKFNQNVKMMFDECPMKDKKVVGCLIKNITIDWKSFTRWLEDNNILEEKEKKNMQMLRLYDTENKEVNKDKDV